MIMETTFHLLNRYIAGDVKFAEINMEDGKSTGVGKVRFSTHEDAIRAVSILSLEAQVGLNRASLQIQIRLIFQSSQVGLYPWVEDFGHCGDSGS